MTHYLRQVILSWHHRCSAGLMVMSVLDLSERRAFFSWLVRLSLGRLLGPWSSNWWILSLTALTYVSKAGSLLQGGPPFPFFPKSSDFFVLSLRVIKELFQSKPPEKLLYILLQLELVNLWWFWAKWKTPWKQIILGTWEGDTGYINYHIMIMISIRLFLFARLFSMAVFFCFDFVPEKTFDFSDFMLLYLSDTC